MGSMRRTAATLVGLMATGALLGASGAGALPKDAKIHDITLKTTKNNYVMKVDAYADTVLVFDWPRKDIEAKEKSSGIFTILRPSSGPRCKHLQVVAYSRGNHAKDEVEKKFCWKS